MRPRFIVPLIAILAIMLVYRVFWRGAHEPLVVYCAHDSIYADGIIRQFEKETGIAVAIRYDTEATKSLGLVELLIREKAAPRCDVFWNNELLGTMDLMEQGMLQPYEGPGYRRIPAAFKDPGGSWCGFAARMRVYIVNTKKLAPREDTIAKVLSGDLSRVAIAKPLYGTTLTHYTVLWETMGRDGITAWHQDLLKRGIRTVDGNSAVKDAVAQGVCDLGFTDTDDFFDAKDDGKPVAMVPVRLETGVTICIPNTVSIIRGTRRAADAQRLVDYLLSGQTEMALARAKSRQIPLGPVRDEDLPAEVLELKKMSEKQYALASLATAHAQCLAWLKSVYLQ